MALYMVGTFITMMFAKIIAGYVADKIGRRIVFAFGTMGTALFIPVVVYMHNADNIGVLMLIFGFLYGIPYAINATYLTESFPTGYVVQQLAVHSILVVSVQSSLQLRLVILR